MFHDSYKVLAAVVLLGSLCAPANAQFKHIDKDHLPMADQIERSRLKIRVRREGPEVKYDPAPQAQPIYLIPTGLPQTAPPSVIVMPGAPMQPGAATAGSGSQRMIVPPGYAVVDPNNPAPARFESNIPLGGMRGPSGLPSGITTGVHTLSGRLNPGQPAVQARPATPQTAPRRPTVDTYQTQPASTGSGMGQGSTQQRVQTNVVGVVKRGGLLKH